MKLIRVLTWNIHKGFSTGKREFVLERIRRELRAVNPDLVFLQEVVGRHDLNARRVAGWPDMSQADYLAERHWEHVLYGKNRSYRHGHHGNALLSKFPVEQWDNLNVTAHAFEGRGVLHARITIGRNRIVNCGSLHLSLLRRGRDRQLSRIADLIADQFDNDEPLIIAGDFNDWTERASRYLSRHASLQEVFELQTGRHAKTFPSRMPILRLDRIYFRGLEVRKTISYGGSPWNELSDHAPIEAHFAFANERVP